MPIFPTNYTISDVTYSNVPKNIIVTSLHPTAVLLITPLAGYVVNNSEFSVPLPLPPNTTGVVFTQSGLNVICTVSFSPAFVMPASNVEIPICISGFAKLKNYNITGQINVTKTNATSSPANPNFNILSSFNSVVVAKTITLSANNNFYFPVEPTLEQTVGDASIFTITNTKVFNTNGNLLSKTFIISCTVPDYNSLSNIFEATAIAFAIPGTSSKIRNYILSDSDFPLSGGTAILTLYGDPSTPWNLSEQYDYPILQTGPADPATGVIPYGETAIGTIGPNGQSSILINISEFAINKIYSILLTPSTDLLGQTSPILLYQFDSIDIIYKVGSSVAFVNDGPKTNTGPGLSSPSVLADDGFFNDFNWEINANQGYTLELMRQPSIEDIANLNPAFNGNNLLQIYEISAEQEDEYKIKLNIKCGVQTYGRANMAALINLQRADEEGVLCIVGTGVGGSNIEISNNSNNATITNVKVGGQAVIISEGSFPVASGSAIAATYSVPSSSPYEIEVFTNNATSAPVTITSSLDPQNPFCGITSGSINCTSLNLSQGPSIAIFLGSDGGACQ